MNPMTNTTGCPGLCDLRFIPIISKRSSPSMKSLELRRREQTRENFGFMLHCCTYLHLMFFFVDFWTENIWDPGRVASMPGPLLFLRCSTWIPRNASWWKEKLPGISRAQKMRRIHQRCFDEIQFSCSLCRAQCSIPRFPRP